MTQHSTTASERRHASLDKDCLHLSAVKVWCASGEFLEIDIVLVHIHLARVNLHDAGAGFLIWQGQFNLAIKTTRAQQSWIEDIRSVCRRNDLDVVILRETIKLVKQLKHSSMHFTSLTLARVSLCTDSI